MHADDINGKYSLEQKQYQEQCTKRSGYCMCGIQQVESGGGSGNGSTDGSGSELVM